MGDGGGQERVALQRLGAGGFAGIDIRLAGISGGVDDEFGPGVPQMFQQRLKVGVIDLPARKGLEVPAASREFGGKSLAHVTGSAEKENHVCGLDQFRDVTTNGHE